MIGENGTASEIKIGSEFTQSEAYTNKLDLLGITATNGSVKVGKIISPVSLFTSIIFSLRPTGSATAPIFSLKFSS